MARGARHGARLGAARPLRRAALVAVARVAVTWAGAALAACGGDATAPEGTDDPLALSGSPAAFRWALPAGVLPPPVPADNPMSPAKVELGRRLFYDPRLSVNGAFSCASCHRQEFAFADARNVSVGATGEVHPRNAIGLANTGYQRTLGWASPPTTQLEGHAELPMFAVDPVEMGLRGREAPLLAELGAVPLYRSLFATAFPGEATPVSVRGIVRALAAFQRTLVSANAPADRHRRGEAGAMSAAAVRGLAVFRAKGCADCHAGADFTLATTSAPLDAHFANTGLYNVGGTGAYPARNQGLREHTGRDADMGRMKIPSLRNVALTFPYGHDGSVGSLEAVLDQYARGGRLVRQGPLAGDGRDSPHRDPRLRPVTFAGAEREELLAFLQALTDSSFVSNPAFANPWR
jgi:cytochrome c peroxidase